MTVRTTDVQGNIISVEKIIKEVTLNDLLDLCINLRKFTNGL